MNLAHRQTLLPAEHLPQSALRRPPAQGLLVLRRQQRELLAAQPLPRAAARRRAPRRLPAPRPKPLNAHVLPARQVRVALFRRRCISQDRCLCSDDDAQDNIEDLIHVNLRTSSTFHQLHPHQKPAFCASKLRKQDLILRGKHHTCSCSSRCAACCSAASRPGEAPVCASWHR